MRVPFIFLAVIAAMASWAPAAAASEARVQGGTLFYTAAAGETNALSVTHVFAIPSYFVVSDPGATITAGTGCMGSGGSSTRCSGFSSIDASLGDGNDSSSFDEDEVLLTQYVPVIVRGGSGNDLLKGGRMNDQLYGEAGQDALWGRVGNDTLDAGADYDELHGEAGDDTLYAGLGRDNVHGDVGNDTLWGADDPTMLGNDLLFGDAGNDELHGRRGFDLLDGGPDNDVLDGGDGSDAASFQSAGGSVTADLALETAAGPFVGTDSFVGIEDLVGSSYDDSLTGTDGTNSIWGAGGRDIISGGGGGDQLWGDGGAAGELTESLSRVCAFCDAGWDDDEIHGGAGQDHLRGGYGSDELHGTADNDTLYGDPAPDDTGGNDLLDGGDGTDQLFGYGGDDQYVGGGGRDRLDFFATNQGIEADLSLGTITGEGADLVTGIEDLRGTEFADHLIGNDGPNFIFGGYEDDVLEGGAGDDQLFGGEKDDELYGGPGDDQLNDEPGIDSLVGGVGIDTLFSGAGSVVNLEAGTLDAVETLAEIENVIGGYDIRGSDGPNVVESDFAVRIIGLGGDDVLVGGTEMDGGEGDDRLKGFLQGAGRTLRGGPGFDVVDYEGEFYALVVDLEVGTAEAAGGGFQETLAEIEEVIGSEQGDVFRGNAGANRFVGRGGDDELLGRAGNDTLIGEGGEDEFNGGAGADRLESRDGVAEILICDGEDSLDIDPIDVLVGCVAPAPPPPVVQDATAPTVTLVIKPRHKLLPALRKGLRATAGCSEACAMQAKLLIARKLAKRLKLPTIVGKATRNLAAAGTTNLVVKFTAKARRKLAKLSSVRLTLAITAVDAAGNAAVARRAATLRR